MSEPRRPPWLTTEVVVGAVYIVGMFMSIMDGTIVTTALPTIARQFGTTPTQAEWVVIGYLLSLAAWIPASGWVGDRIGTKKTFLFALALFTAASVLCGVARSLDELIAFRVLQGVGGGMLAPVGQAMLFRAFPPERRAKASTVLVVGTALAPATGPLIGGVLVTDVSWRWCFYVNVPMGIGAFLFGLLFLEEHREPSALRFDLAGFVLSGSGLALVLYAISEGPGSGWGSPSILASAIGGIGVLGLLVVVELRHSRPMLMLRLLRDRIFRVTNLTSLFGTTAFLGSLFIVPQFLQVARGASALSSGLTTFPEALGVILMSQVVGRIYPLTGPRRLMMAGTLGVAAAMIAMTNVGLHTSVWTARSFMFLLGVSWAFVFIPLQAAAFATISPADTGRGSAIFNTQRQVGSALGAAITATVFSESLRALAPSAAARLQPAVEVGAYHRSFLVAGIMALVAVCVASRVRDADAAATMQRRGNVPPTRDQAPGSAAPAREPGSPGEVGSSTME